MALSLYLNDRFSYRRKRIQSMILPFILCLLSITVLNSFFIQKAYPEEPDNNTWYTGEKYRDGVKLFIPGDVPESALRQKRTAEYKVQQLVMDVPEKGKIYNSASLAVMLPTKEDNEKRAIPVEKKEIHIESKIQSTVTEESSLTHIYITEPNNTFFIYNIHTKEKESIEEISAETTKRYFGELNNHPFDITVTLQGNSVRFTYYHLFLRRWGGPISAVIWMKAEELPVILERIAQGEFPSRMIFNLYVDEGEDYPINVLRNMAIKAVPTTHFFLADMDVWPSPTVYSNVVEILNPTKEETYANGDSSVLVGEVMTRKTSALIIPVYEYTKACGSFKTCVRDRENTLPITKSALRTCLSKRSCRHFREGQNLHNYYFDEWLYDNFTQPVVKIQCFVKDKQEPYMIVRKSDTMPMFDERFKNYGYNKVQWVSHLRYSGYRFYVLGTDFAMDVAHPRSPYQKNFLSTMKNQHLTLNQSTYSSFLNEILKHGRQSVTRTCRKNDIEAELGATLDFLYVCRTINRMSFYFYICHTEYWKVVHTVAQTPSIHQNAR